MIRIENLEKCYPKGGRILHDLNAVVNDGDVISIIGPSGCGKSTFLRCINLLEQASSGKIFLDGEEITAQGADLRQVRRKIGMVFQSFNLFENMTVVENVMFPQLKVLKRSRREAYSRAMDLLRSVGMEEKALSYPAQLSGGQKQRAAIARTLSVDPETILFDEPTSALDPAMVEEVEIVIRRLAKSGVTMLVVTHSMELARKISNRIFYMDEGGVYEEGSPEELFSHPKKPKTRAFLRRLKVMDYTVTSPGFDFTALLAASDSFSNANRLPERLGKQLYSVLEELIVRNLGPALAGKRVLRISAEYRPEEKKLHLLTDYGGDPFDARSLLVEGSCDGLSLMILKANIRGSDYRFLPDSDLPNRIIFKIGDPDALPGSNP